MTNGRRSGRSLIIGHCELVILWSLVIGEALVICPTGYDFVTFRRTIEEAMA
jgi:hypothetical protein